MFKVKQKVGTDNEPQHLSGRYDQILMNQIIGSFNLKDKDNKPNVVQKA